MRAVSGVTLVCLICSVVYCAETDDGAPRPTPPEVIEAIKKLGGTFRVDKNKAVVTLRLAGAEATDADLVHLEGLKNLESLNLSGTMVTDAGLVHLKGLTKLHSLNLHFTKVTDAGLEHLKGLRNLESLGLSGTDVTDAGVKQLQQALPECEISH